MLRTLPLGGEEVYRVVNEVLSSNSYICRTAVPGDCFLIDPGFDVEVILSELACLELTPSKIYCTHGHFDHIGCAALLQKTFCSPVFLHSADLKIARSSNFLLKAFRFPYNVIQPDFSLVEEGFEDNLNGTPLRFIHTPGHTDGSSIIEYGTSLFTGDTIYSRGLALSRLPGGKPDLLRRSIRHVWNLLSEDRIVFPGHGEILPAALVRTSNHALMNFIGLDPLEND